MLVVAEPATAEFAIAARLLLTLSGHHVEVKLASNDDEVEICRAWLRWELGGVSGDEA